jgi:AcrR family transcriptional regulator
MKILKKADAGCASPKGRATREKIFEVATGEFARKGYAGARIEEIAALAGINKQRIYAYFQDKEGLFIEVWKHTFALIYEEDRGLLDLTEKDIPGLGRLILTRYMTFHQRHPEFWRIFVTENLLGGRHGRPGRPPGDQPFLHLRTLYEKGQDTGWFRSGVSFESFLFVLMAVSFFYTSNMNTMSDTLQVDLADPDIRSRMIDEICTMMFAGNDND